MPAISISDEGFVHGAGRSEVATPARTIAEGLCQPPWEIVARSRLHLPRIFETGHSSPKSGDSGIVTLKINPDRVWTIGDYWSRDSVNAGQKCPNWRVQFQADGDQCDRSLGEPTDGVKGRITKHSTGMIFEESEDRYTSRDQSGSIATTP